MARIRTYLKSGQFFETVGRVKVTSNGFGLTSADWNEIKSGERVIYASVEEIAAITEVIEPKAIK